MGDFLIREDLGISTKATVIPIVFIRIMQPMESNSAQL